MKRVSFVSVDMVKTGQTLKRACAYREISAREMQRQLNLGSVQAVYNWFHGVRIPTVDNLMAISRLLRLPVDALLVEKLSREMSGFLWRAMYYCRIYKRNNGSY